ncbi:HEXXH motif-containing putative peptide modification protein [Streptomyces sp. R33]|uniref:HEXXH motif-containing putative peptide modification protein n=1 Tax=Streptomyces sp. R33 TaxID=3238629 RepID=A0AB39YJU9_9ACTN
MLPFADRIFAENRGGELKTHASVKGFVGHDSSTSLLQYLSHRGGKLVFLPAFAAQGPAFTAASTDELPTALTTVTDSLLVDVESAFDLLKSFAPIYLDWVTKVVKYAVPLTPVSGRDVSHSSNMRPATIAFSANRNPAALAETLVHEASHQYCNILRRLGRLDDGTDPTVYHSPLRDTGRPIGKILVAYHAVANIFLWNRISMDAGAADIDHFHQNAVTLPRQLQVLDEALVATRSLTPLGKLLWEPLRARVLQAMS